MRLDVRHSAKSASVSVVNDGAEKLSFQLQAMDWSQDLDGKDLYTESRDLIFFPKLMSVEPGQEAIVRIGFKTNAASVEKTYRLFIEELPGVVKKVEGSSAQINFLVRFGLPIFAAPALPHPRRAADPLAARLMGRAPALNGDDPTASLPAHERERQRTGTRFRAALRAAKRHRPSSPVDDVSEASTARGRDRGR